MRTAYKFYTGSAQTLQIWINFKSMTRCKIILSAILLVVAAGRTLAQNHPAAEEESPGLVKWLSFKEAFELNKKQSKPFIIDVYTDWCGWCKHMMKTTYSDPGIASYINTWFYPVKFDAETKDSISYQGTMYYNPVNKVNPGKSTHQLALKLLGNQLMYPTTLFANYASGFILNSQGYLDNTKIEPMLVYTLENVYRTTAYEEFRVQFEKAFHDTTRPKDELKKYTFNQALELQKKEPRKLIVDIYTDWCNGCRVMNKTTFSDTANAAYINKHFYLIEFNAESKDSVRFKDHTYFNDGSNGTPFHQLAMALVKHNMALPSTVLIDENLQLLPYQNCLRCQQ